MKKLSILLLLALSLCCTGCSHYSDISGRVVDGSTGKPIEGALVVAQWTKPRGLPGMQYHDLHKIVETLTDKDGQFLLGGTSGFIVNQPEMIIYKEGYIPWRNDSIFPSSSIVKEHEWKNNVTYRLEAFTGEYSYQQLYGFLDFGIIGGDGRRTPIFFETHRNIGMKGDGKIRQ